MSMAAKIGGAPQRLNEWGRTAEIDSAIRPGVPSKMKVRLSDPARPDEALGPEIRRVFEENCQVHGLQIRSTCATSEGTLYRAELSGLFIRQ